MNEDGAQLKPLRGPSDAGAERVRGYDIHVVFESAQAPEACVLFDRFQAYLAVAEIAHDRPMVFSEPVGPWPTPMWQVLLPQSERVDRDLGLCISWLMLNRGPFSVMVHPNTVKSDGSSASYEDHSAHMLWLGPPLQLRLDALI